MIRQKYIITGFTKFQICTKHLKHHFTLKMIPLHCTGTYVIILIDHMSLRAKNDHPSWRKNKDHVSFALQKVFQGISKFSS